MAIDIPSAIDSVQAELARLADPDKAAGMQAYMKTEMPFYGVQKPGRVSILRHLRKTFAPASRMEYEALTVALWELPHREEKYLAQGVATAFKQHIVPESLPLYTRFIVEGAWWDFVDDADMWLRRSSIICQVGAKEHTDTVRLFRNCERRWPISQPVTATRCRASATGKPPSTSAICWATERASRALSSRAWPAARAPLMFRTRGRESRDTHFANPRGERNGQR